MSLDIRHISKMSDYWSTIKETVSYLSDTSLKKRVSPIHNGTLWTLLWSNMWKVIMSFVWLEKWLILINSTKFMKQEIPKSLLQGNNHQHSTSYQTHKCGSLIHPWSDKGFKGNVVNQTYAVPVWKSIYKVLEYFCSPL